MRHCQCHNSKPAKQRDGSIDNPCSLWRHNRMFHNDAAIPAVRITMVSQFKACTKLFSYPLTFIRCTWGFKLLKVYSLWRHDEMKSSHEIHEVPRGVVSLSKGQKWWTSASYTVGAVASKTEFNIPDSWTQIRLACPSPYLCFSQWPTLKSKNRLVARARSV